jgi:LysR family transcriptional regulator for metE and metH
MDLEVKHLRLVKAVAEFESLTKASHHLHLTQSALSHQLRDVERRLGAPLFTRINRRMVLTAAGQRLLDSAQAVLAELQKTEQDIRDGATSRVIPLRISTECYTCYHWLPAVMKPFREKFPSVELKIDAASTPHPLLPLLEGKLDLAIMMSPVRDARLRVRTLFEDELVAVMCPDHRLADRSFVRLEDFRDERLLIYSARDDSYVINTLLAPAGVTPAAVETLALTEAIVELVKAGVGVAVLARWSVQPHLDAGTLRGLRVTSRGCSRQWKAAVPKHLARANYIEEFVGLVQANSPVRKPVPILPFKARGVGRRA